VIVLHEKPSGPAGAGLRPGATPVSPEALSALAAAATDPGAGAPAPGEIAHGVVETRRVAPDGSVVTERQQLDVHVERGTPPHVLLYRGDHAADRVPVPTSGVEDAIARFTRRLLLASLGLFAGGLLLAVAVAHRFTRPLRELAAAARRVGEGDLGVRAPAAPGEVGEAVIAFNQMSQQLLDLDAEARRLRANEQLSELGEVGRGIAHSLRNPLNALGLALEQLAERAVPEEDDDGAETSPMAIAASARRQIRRIDAALRGFLALSAGDAAAQEVDLADVARDVALEALQTRPSGEPARVEVVAPQPVRLVGVEAELRAVLQALVVNAIEASPAGAQVVVRLEPAPTTAAAGAPAGATVLVEDTGSGLPPAVRERLFTPHVTTKASGAGMGLYLAHRLATTRYGGSLALVDREEGGTRATLRLLPRGAATPGGASHGG
jgi:signal transduction histidine kinase